MNTQEKIVIVGGVAGGSTAATRLRRLNEHAEIRLFERGEHISFANCGIPYYIGGVIPERKALLLQTAAGMKARYNIDVFPHTEAIAVDLANKTVTVRDLSDGRTWDEPYDRLVLSPGAKPRAFDCLQPDGKRVFSIRSLADADAVYAAVKGGGNALVVGGGFIGIELSENLQTAGLGVTLVEAAPQIAGFVDPEFVSPIVRSLKTHEIPVYCNCAVTGSDVRDDGVTVYCGERSFEADYVLLCAGVAPDTALAEAAGLALGAPGGIAVDGGMRTSDPSVFAVGDAVTVQNFVTGADSLVPLAGPANKQARIAADNISGRHSAYPGTLGASIVKAYDCVTAAVGLNEKQLKRQGAAYRKVYIHAQSHAGYYPGAAPMFLKLLFTPDDGRILGAQITGGDGVDKCIDVLATCLSLGANVRQLCTLELSYAPPFGSAKHPVNVAGYVASNVLDGLVDMFHFDELDAPETNACLIDVRSPREYAGGTIGSAVNIPVDQLRARLNEIPHDRPLRIFCAVGLRGYLACRILTANGFTDVKNLSGGYKLYAMARPVD